MPNHVKHIMEVTGETEKFFEAVKTGELVFDFNKLIPEPEFIKLPDGVDGIPCAVTDAAELIMMYSNWPVYDYRERKKSPHNITNYGHKREWQNEWFPLFERCCKAIMDCGYSNWWPWRVVHWGTKWNAYSTKRENNTIRFETAWNTPKKIWEKIAEMFPGTSFAIRYASEDYGSHCGVIDICAGGLTHTQIDIEEFAYEVWEFDEKEILELTTE